MRASASVEDYLKTVWKLSSAPQAGRTGAEPLPVPPSELARALGVSAPSVSAMVRRLRSGGLLLPAAPGTAVELTAEGVRTALGVVRRHRLLETFLVEVLGLGWDEVHAEAEILEHALTPRVERAIADRLGQPIRDPHGDPIPPSGDQDGPRGHREDWGQPLAAAGGSGDFVVDRVEDVDPTVLRHLADLGVVPGVRLHLDGVDEHGGPLWVRVCRGTGDPGPGSGRAPLGSGLTRRVHGTLVAAGHGDSAETATSTSRAPQVRVPQVAGLRGRG